MHGKEEGNLGESDPEMTPFHDSKKRKEWGQQNQDNGLQKKTDFNRSENWELRSQGKQIEGKKTWKFLS